MKQRTVATHDGPFHADEVTACALLLLFDLVDHGGIVRSRDPAKLEECEFVCDVGGIYDAAAKRFDHHQVDYTGALSSAGMVLRYLLESGVIDQEIYDLLHNNVVHGVDLHDTGVAPQFVGVCTFSHVVSNMLPVEYHAPAEKTEAAFHRAVDFVVGHLERMIGRFRFNLSCREAVESVMERSEELLLFDRELPWLENFFALGGESHPALFVVMPAGGQWKVRGVPPTEARRMEVRRPLPEQWAGLLGDELERISGIEGAVFCHKARFISVWESLESALLAAQRACATEEES